ncbi:hypothetical protein [Phascolarctobacterium sp.]
MWFTPEYEHIHKDPDQQKRQLSATKIPIASLNTNEQTAIINEYTVTLRDCTCRDFRTRIKPCKHMYRLAYELGYLSPPKKIKEDLNYKGSRVRHAKDEIIKSLKDILDATPLRAQLLFLAYLSGHCTIINTKEAEDMVAILEDKGFLIKRLPSKPCLAELCFGLTVTQLKNLYPAVPPKITKREDIISFIENDSDFVQILKKIYDNALEDNDIYYADYYCAPEIEPHKTSIIKFLKRKKYKSADCAALGFSDDILYVLD